MKTYEIVAVLENCFVQQRIELGRGVYVIPLPPMAFEGQVQYVMQLNDIVGFSVTSQFLEQLKSELVNVQQASLLCIPDIEAASGLDVESRTTEIIETSCDTLSVFCRNRVEPIAVVIRDGEDLAWVRMLPPTNPRIWHAINAPSYIHLIEKIQEKALIHPEFRLLCRLFRISQQTRRSDFRIFHSVQILEVAADRYDGYLAQKLRGLLEDLQLHAEIAAIPERLNIQLPDNKDFVNVLVELRNAMAHDGELNTTTVKPFVFPFIHQLEETQKEITELIRVVLTAIAVDGLDNVAMTLEGPATFEIKFFE